MSLSKPSWYLEEKVLPSVKDFQADRESEARASAAMISVHQFAERVFEYCKQSKPEYLTSTTKSHFLGQIREAHSDIALLARVGNTLKHHRIEQKGLVYTATGATCIEQGVVWVCDENHQPIRQVEDLLQSSITFWRQWLRSHPDT